MKSMGVASGCGCKEVYRFPHITYPYSSCIRYFLQQHPYFLKKNLMCFVLLHVLFVIYVRIFSRNINTNTATSTDVPRLPYEGLHIMFYTRRSTHKRTLHILRRSSAVCLKRGGCRSLSRGCALYKDKPRAGLTRARPASFKGRRSRTRGRSQCVLVKIWRSIWNTYLVWRC